MRFIDSHTHLYLKDFDTDIESVIERATEEGVGKFYLPAIDSSVHTDMLSIELRFPGVCIAMMGLHPCSVKENFTTELKLVQEWLSQRQFAAVGEIGLDYYWDTKFVAQQKHAFEQQMEWALEYRLPIVIHTRNAMTKTIEIVKPFAAKGLHGIFHCFGDSVQSASNIIDMGFYLGIGGVLTYKKSGLDEVMKHVPIDAVVLETDSPYLAPVPFRGKRNESSYIRQIAERLAQVKGIAIEDIAAATTANAEKIFAL